MTVPLTILCHSNVIKVDLLEPLISLVMISLNGDDDTSLINLLYDLLGKYLNCQRNHGNQKKVV